jgi:hypothetical protein
MPRPLTRTLYLLLFVTWIGVCASSVYYINTTPDVAPTFTVVPAPTFVPTVPSTPGPIQRVQAIPDRGDSSWALLQPGLERRLFKIYDAQNGLVESVYVWRLDQDHFRFDVAFEATPRTLESWQRETNAAIVLNGGFYSIDEERHFPDGLIVVNGEASGRSFNGYGGMLAIDRSRAEVRWLVDRPYQPGEQLQAALQAFPILVKPGGQLGFGAERENNVPARRTVIAQDREGRILMIVTPEGYFTLHQLSAYLTESDLNLDVALNLDGGGSTGILVANPPELISPTRPIPFVILAYPR